MISPPKSVVIISILFVGAICDELYENSRYICEKCSCSLNGKNETLTLDCANRSLRHTLSNWPVHGDFLVATFTNNSLITLETLPPTDAQLQIVYSHCGIKYLHPGLFENTKNVEYADFSYNFLTSEEISTDKFKGPYNDSKFEPIGLKNLNLAYNRIHSLGKNVFEHMPDLRVLNLEGNHLTVLDIQTQLALSSIQNLEILNLANNQLTELVENAVSTQKNLIELNLGRNDLDFVPESLSLIGESLEKLTIDGNPILKLVDNTFLGLHKLSELSANNLTKLKYVNANAFAPLIHLKKLSLSNNPKLTIIDREAFGINQTIHQLYLNNNKLFSLDANLIDWTRLIVCQFKNNPLECSCDLFNITKKLSRDITRNGDLPYCIHPITQKSMQVFRLTSTICGVKRFSSSSLLGRAISHRFSMLRLSMIILSIVLTVATSVAVCLVYTRYRKIQRNRNYPFATQVFYNPLSTNPRF